MKYWAEPAFCFVDAVGLARRCRRRARGLLSRFTWLALPFLPANFNTLILRPALVSNPFLKVLYDEIKKIINPDAQPSSE